MLLVAITGKAGSGKDTFAAMLVEAAKERGRYAVVDRFAAPIKAVIARMAGILPSDMEDRDKKENMMIGNNSLRRAMQVLGMWGRSVDEDFWVKQFTERTKRYPAGSVVVVADCRFDSEAVAVQNSGGYVIKIEREGSGLQGEEGNDPSEAGVSESNLSFTIHNNGSLTDLRAHADWVANIVLFGNGRPIEYGDY